MANKMFSIFSHQGNANQNYIKKTTLKLHLTPVRMVIKNANKESLYVIGENVNYSATMENSIRMPQKTKNRLLKETKSAYVRESCTPMLFVAVFIVAK
jgi:hypothetical protein